MALIQMIFITYRPGWARQVSGTVFSMREGANLSRRANAGLTLYAGPIKDRANIILHPYKACLEIPKQQQHWRILYSPSLKQKSIFMEAAIPIFNKIRDGNNLNFTVRITTAWFAKSLYCQGFWRLSFVEGLEWGYIGPARISSI